MALPTIWIARIVFILGITNILSIIATRFTCRCMGAGEHTAKLYKYKWFQKLYSYHCIYWRIFIISVIVHAIFAITLIGFPFG